MKKLWKIYGDVLNKSKIKKKININSLKTEEAQLSDPHPISNALNSYFGAIGIRWPT